jgi:hypothetical protein
MCGPSKAMKNLNNMVQGFTSQVTSEAGTVFGNSNVVFNNIMNAVQGIAAGGPSQMGITGPALDAMNAEAERAGATLARNVKGAAIATGGNVATPAGENIATTLNADLTGAASTAQQKNEIQQASAAIGRENYERAITAETNAPGVFGGATNFNETAGSQQQEAEVSQQNMDTQNSWWKGPVLQANAAAAKMIPFAGKYVSQEVSNINQNYQTNSQALNKDWGGSSDSSAPSGDFSSGSGWGSNG